MLQGTNKYLNDLFYVGPLYHQIFTNLDKLIFLDVGNHQPSFQIHLKFSSDLEFYRDVKLLYKQFAHFDSSQLIGVRITFPICFKNVSHAINLLTLLFR